MFFDEPLCYDVASTVLQDSRISPGCFNSNCSLYGIANAVDGNGTLQEWGILARSGLGANQFLQLGMGIQRSDVLAVRLVARNDSSLEESQGVDVFLSPGTNHLASDSVLCASNVTFDGLGEDEVVLCPVNTTARYVTVARTGTAGISMLEIMPLLESEWILCIFII